MTARMFDACQKSHKTKATFGRRPQITMSSFTQLRRSVKPSQGAWERIRGRNGMPKRLTYIQRASRIFLLGTRYRSPADAVEAGERTLEEWTDTLNRLREAEWETQAEIRDRRTQKAKPEQRTE